MCAKRYTPEENKKKTKIDTLLARITTEKTILKEQNKANTDKTRDLALKKKMSNNLSAVVKILAFHYQSQFLAPTLLMLTETVNYKARALEIVACFNYFFYEFAVHCYIFLSVYNKLLHKI